MPGASEPSIVVDAWNVPDGSQEEFLSAMVALMERLRELDGFRDGQILTGVNHTQFVSWATFDSMQAREAAYVDPEIGEMLRRLGGLARPRPHAYRVARRFAPREP